MFKVALLSCRPAYSARLRDEEGDSFAQPLSKIE
jgi:hypothetical protein